MKNSSEVSAGETSWQNAQSDSSLRSLESVVLFGADKEIVIRHSGQDYHLRITRQNKLILTK